MVVEWGLRVVTEGLGVDVECGLRVVTEGF